MRERSFEMKLVGITPLVMNSNATLIGGSGKDDTRDKYAWEVEHFRESAYQNSDGSLYIPARSVKKALILSAKFTTKKPKGVSFKSYGPLIEAALLVDSDAALSATVNDLKPWTAVVNLDPSKGPKGPRGPRCRPMLPVPWKAETTLTVMDDLLSGEVLAELAELAGKRCGLCDARSIDYGRCMVTVKEVA